MNDAAMSSAGTALDYERVLGSIAAWNTECEPIPGFAGYDGWFRLHGKSVSIIVSSYEDHRALIRCMVGLKRIRDTYSNVRVIVSDVASRSEEHRTYLDLIERDGIVVLRNKKSVGLSASINHALSLIRGEDFVLLSSDIEPEGFWLEALQYGCYASGAGIVGAKVLYPDRNIRHAGVYRRPGTRSFGYRYDGVSEFYSVACVAGYHLAVTGASIYIANRTYRKIGKLDPGLLVGLEDVDYCLRAWRSGERVLYYPYARLVLRESPARAHVDNGSAMATRAHFWRKWKTFFDGRTAHGSGNRVVSRRSPDIVYVLEDTGICGGHRNVFDHVNLLIESGLDVELWSLADHPEWYELKTRTRQFKDFGELTSALSPLSSVKVATWWNTAETVWLSSVTHGRAAYLVQDIESSYYPENPVMQAKVLSSYRSEFRYLCTSEWNQQILSRIGVEATVVPCSVDRSVFRPLGQRSRPNVLLTPGRRNYLKNLPFTLTAWAALGDSRPELWMYGAEPDIADGLHRTRYFYKPSDTYLNLIINECMAFVLTSRHEGFGLTILEAMSAGAPVVTTDCHGNRDFCEHGMNCLMIGDGDYSELASSILRIMGDEQLRDRLRQGGLRTAEMFSRENMRCRLLEFFSGFHGLEHAAVHSRPYVRG